MKIGADDPILGERMNPPEMEAAVPAPLLPKGRLVTWRRAFRLVALTLLAPFGAHELWRLALASWGWGG